MSELGIYVFVSVSMCAMTGWEAALWGLLGGAIAESLNLAAAMRPQGPGRRWKWPWTRREDRPIVLVAIALRLLSGAGLAAPLGASEQLPTPFSGFLIGLTAPLVVARLFQMIPVAEPDNAPPYSTAQDPVVSTQDPAVLSEKEQSDAAG
jgi:hypothetical protein